MRTLFRVSLIAFTLSSLATASARADEWRNLIAPYVWGSGLSADITVDGHPVDPESNADFMDNLEFAGMLRYEGHNDKMGILFDAIYAGFGFPSDRTPAELDLSSTVLELAGSWHANDRFEVLFGARYYDISLDVNFDALPDVDESDSWVDGIVGFRGNAPMGDHWKWYFRGDVGAGGSNFAWNAETAFVWSPNETFSLAMGYRVLDTDVDLGPSSADSSMDAMLNGPFLGFVFHF